MRKRRVFPYSAVLAFAFCANLTAQIRVTQNGALNPEDQDGSSWTNALSAAKLRERLSGVSRGGSGGEYWVAMGVYPLLMPQQGVQIYGGFGGTENSREERDPSTNQTTILGIEFAQYDVVDQNNNFLEKKHPDQSVIIDGCTLLAGEAGLALAGNYSPGILLGGAPLVKNCKIVGSAGFASVVNVGHGPVKLVDCEIRSGLGAGLTVGGPEGYVEMINCNIHDNGEAGLISWNDGRLKAVGCIIANNGRDANSRLPAVLRYSGIYVQEASAEIVDSIITENHGELGGGITVVLTELNQHRVLVANSTISSNTTVTAGRFGGGIHAWTFNSPVVDGVTITNSAIFANANFAPTGAGGVYAYGPGTRMDNCKVVSNKTGGNGGGVFIYTPRDAALTMVPGFRNLLVVSNAALNGGGFYLQTTDARIINCTVADNHATNQGGAIFSDGERGPLNSPPVSQKPALIANTALIGNISAEGSLLYHVAAGLFDPGNEPVPPQFTNSAYSKGATAVRRMMGVPEPFPIPTGLTAVSAGQFAGNGDYHPAADSALIDAGENAYAPALDLDLKTRIFGPSVDIGAYESLASAPEPLMISNLSNGRLQIRFSGRLQHTASLAPALWQEVPAVSGVEIEPQGQQGYWRTVTP